MLWKELSDKIFFVNYVIYENYLSLDFFCDIINKDSCPSLRKTFNDFSADSEMGSGILPDEKLGGMKENEKKRNSRCLEKWEKIEKVELTRLVRPRTPGGDKIPSSFWFYGFSTKPKLLTAFISSLPLLLPW